MRFSTIQSATQTLTNKLTSTVAIITIAGVSLFAPLAAVQRAHAASVTVCSAPTCSYSSLQAAVTAVDAGSTITLLENQVTASQVTVSKSLTIEGNGFTLSPSFPFTNNSNNSAIGIISTSNVLVNNLVIDGTAGTSLHGVNVFESTGVVLNGLNVKNNDKYGVAVNASGVTLNNHTSSGNGWGGINLDKGTAAHPASLTINGASNHSGEGPLNPMFSFAVFIDNPSNTYNTFTDNTYQYKPSVFPGSYSATAPLPACNGAAGGFETFAVGSVNGQGGWSVTNSEFDQAVVPNSYGYAGMGCRALRISNSYTSGSFGDQTFSNSTANETGETTATNGGYSSGSRQTRFEAQFDIASTSAMQQPGMSLSVSPDRGDGSRMSYLSFVDGATGLDVTFYDVSGTSSPVTFVPTSLGTITRDQVHNIKFAIEFKDGPSNDVVQIYIDGVLVHTGTTWENYYRYDAEAAAEQGPRTTDSLLFRAGGAAAPLNDGGGYLFDNVVLSSSTPTTGGSGSTGGSTGGGSSTGGTTTTSSNTGTARTSSQSGNNDDNADDGDVVADAGQILGLTTNTPSNDDDGDVKGSSTDNDDDKKDANNSSNFLGLGWWWLAVLAALALLLAFLRRRGREQN